MAGDEEAQIIERDLQILATILSLKKKRKKERKKERKKNKYISVYTGSVASIQYNL